MEPVAVDLSALRRPAGLGDILAYERCCRIPFYRRFLAVLAAVLLFTAAMLVGLWWLASEGILATVPLIGVFAVAYTVLAAAGFVWFAVDLGRRVKIGAFAWGNGWAYADSLERTGRRGSAFTRVVLGRERAIVAGDDPRMPFELGRHYSISRGQQRATVQRPFAFLELPLPSDVPHIVLRNRQRSIIPTLGLGRGAARMDLEGEFARTFQLIVPEGYEQDALYIFTPDLMASVVDLGSGAEIELIGSSVFVYLPHRTRFDRPETMAAALVLAEEFHRRFANRTLLYRDDAAGDLAARAGVSIGLKGQRLSGTGISLFAVAGTVGFLLLCAGVTAFSLFGGDILRSFGAG